jgi:hypothetical protein
LELKGTVEGNRRKIQGRFYGNEIGERHRPTVRTPAQGFKGDHAFIEASEEEDPARGIRGVSKTPAVDIGVGASESAHDVPQVLGRVSQICDCRSRFRGETGATLPCERIHDRNE